MGSPELTVDIMCVSSDITASAPFSKLDITDITHHAPVSDGELQEMRSFAIPNYSVHVSYQLEGCPQLPNFVCCVMTPLQLVAKELTGCVV